MKENNQKKMLLSVLGVAILVVAVVGISFAAFNTTFKSDTNSVSTGTVVVSYNESGNAISVTDALPLSDENGIAQTPSFTFSVATTTTNALEIPYEITLTKVTTGSPSFDSMADNQVKVHMTKDDAPVTGTASTGLKVSELTSPTFRTDGSKLLYRATDTHSAAGTMTSNYELKMWIASDATYDDNTSSPAASSVNGKEYHAKVNVDSHVNPIGSNS